MLRRSIMLSIGVMIVGALTTPQTARAQQARSPRYLPAMQEELTRLGVDPVCEPLGSLRARCTFRRVTRDGEHEIHVHMTYSDESDTLYLYIPQLVVAPPENESTTQVLRRVAELNWRMLTTKFEWNASDGEVRLSALLHTDSNFDRRAFRNLVRVLLTQAERYRPELERLVEADEL